jgi:predicted DNA-binding transcriptional regulator AlpA
MIAATSTHLLTQSVREEIADLFDVNAVALKLGGCSTRHVRRMADGGQMPPPVKLGALVRWRRQDIDSWIAGGCKPVRVVGKGAQQ